MAEERVFLREAVPVTVLSVALLAANVALMARIYRAGAEDPAKRKKGVGQSDASP